MPTFRTRLWIAVLLLVTSLACSTSTSPVTMGQGGTGGDSDPASGSGASGGSVAPSCGDAGQPCCESAQCNAQGLVCLGGTCMSSETGKSCGQNGDCQSGICLPVGDGLNVCTDACEVSGDCAAGWSCGPLVGQQSNICQCSASAEACDAIDNDCDAIVDDQPAADLACAYLGDGAVCQNGQCACSEGYALCGGACTTTNGDPSNCGECGNVCPAGAQCSGGRCTCTGDKTLCGNACVDTGTDPNHCGGCGVKCALGATCTANGCDCPGNLVVCDGKCVDTSSDPEHCGGCGEACPAGVGCHFITGYGLLCCVHLGEPCSLGCCPDLNACSGLTNPPSCVY